MADSLEVEVLTENIRVNDANENVVEETKNIKHKPPFSGLIDFYLNSKASVVTKNPLEWYVIGSYVPGDHQEYIANQRGEGKLKYTFASLAGNLAINTAKVWGAVELFQNSSQGSSLYESVEKIGGWGLVGWTAKGALEMGLRSYYSYRTGKPIGGLTVEATYQGGRGFLRSIRKAYEMAKSRNGNGKKR